MAELTKIAIPSTTVVGYSLLDHRGKPSTPIYTDEMSPRIDKGQYDDGKGPCLDAADTRTVVRVDDVAGMEAVYPRFSRAAQKEGINSTLSLPLVVADKGVGAMNLYSPNVNGFSADDEADGVLLAASISVLVANVVAYWNAMSLIDHLNEALSNRAVIEQAKGILMAQRRGSTPDEAFQLLKQASQQNNVKLRDIAQSIIDRSVEAKPLEGTG